jgi:hypothetical protein
MNERLTVVCLILKGLLKHAAPISGQRFKTIL